MWLDCLKSSHPIFNNDMIYEIWDTIDYIMERITLIKSSINNLYKSYIGNKYKKNKAPNAFREKQDSLPLKLNYTVYIKRHVF